jgi:osmotically-inducible protein OsmY
MLNEHLEHHVNQKLLANNGLSSQRIDVTADSGVVTLHGNVQSYRRKLTAQEIAMADQHVQEVHNELVVATPNDHSPDFLAETVNLLVDNADGLSNESIVVSSKSSSVTLSGYVSTELEKARVADIACSVDGVMEVTNLLIVNPNQVAKNCEHCRTILRSLSSIIGLSGENLRLSVVNETARLSGWVKAAWMRDAAEVAVRGFGILTLANDVAVEPTRR